jgi:hypothetical protein
MKIFWTLIISFIPLLGFSQGPRTAKEAFHQMKDNEAIILDVREKWEIKGEVGN